VGFAKVRVAAGSSVTTCITLDRHAYRTWDLGGSRWVRRTGAHELRIGRSSVDISHRVVVQP
jgi:beta-glucosidase